MPWPEVSTETLVGDAVSAVAATLLPVAMVGIPALGPMLLPCTALLVASRAGRCEMG
jgi:hypothetical protein